MENQKSKSEMDRPMWMRTELPVARLKVLAADTTLEALQKERAMRQRTRRALLRLTVLGAITRATFKRLPPEERERILRQFG